MANNTIELIIKAQDQATSALKSVTQALSQYKQEVGQADQKSNQATSSFTSLTSAITKQGKSMLGLIGITASLGGAFYGAYKITNTWKSLMEKAIEVVDDYRLKVIETGAIVGSLVDKSVPREDAFRAASEYGKWLYGAAVEAEARLGAKASEIWTLTQEFARRGFASVTQDQVNNIALLGNALSVSVRGLGNKQFQIYQELRNLFLEKPRMIGAQLMQDLEKIDPAFKVNIENARKLAYAQKSIQPILDYLLDKFNAYLPAAEKLRMTWSSLTNSIKTSVSTMAIIGLGPAYDEISAYLLKLRDLVMENGKFTETGKQLTLALYELWTKAKQPLVEFIDEILRNPQILVTWVSQFIDFVTLITKASLTIAKFVLDVASGIMWLKDRIIAPFLFMAEKIDFVLGLFGEFYSFLSRNAPTTFFSGVLKQLENVAQAAMDPNLVAALSGGLGPSVKKDKSIYYGKFKSAQEEDLANWNKRTQEYYNKIISGITPRRGAGDDKSKSIEGQYNRLLNMIKTFEQEQARILDGGFAAIDKWYEKQIQTIDQVLKRAQHQQTKWTPEELAQKAREEAFATAQAKRVELSKKFYDWQAGAEEDLVKQVQLKWTNLLVQYGGLSREQLIITKEKAKGIIDEIMGRQEQIAKVTTSLYGPEKTKEYLSAMAGLTPMLSDQLILKEQALALEISIGRSQLDNWLLTKTKMEPAEKERIRLLYEQLSVEKKLSLERERWVHGGGISEGLELYRSEVSKKTSMFSGVWWKDQLNSVENWVGSTFANTAMDIFEKRKTDWKAMGKQIFAGLIGEFAKEGFRKLFGGGGGGITEGLKKLFGSGSVTPRIQGGVSEWGDVPNVQSWDDVAQKWSVVGDQNMEAGQGLTMSGVQGIAAAGGLALAGIGMLTGSQSLMTAGVALSAAASALTIAAFILEATGWMPFHSGGIIAHSGLIVGNQLARAHSGLALDERIIIGQTGEGILPRSTMSKLGRRRFEALRRGDIGAAGENQVVSVGDVHLHIYESQMNAQKADMLVRKYFIPALNRKLGCGIK